MNPQTYPFNLQPNKTPDWTCDEVIQLIEGYSQRPALWNPECNDYKNKFKKQQDWMDLAAIFKCDKVEVERKMKILNSQYRRERIKAIKMRKAGLPHRITWYGYKSFAFLNKNFKVKKNNFNVVKEEQPEEESFREDSPKVRGSYADKVYNTTDETKGGENTPNFNHTIMNESYRSDEWMVFGELVAHVLRKLPDERTRCMVKYKINTVLYEAEISNFK